MTYYVKENVTQHGWRGSKNASLIEQLEISKED